MPDQSQPADSKDAKRLQAYREYRRKISHLVPPHHYLLEHLMRESRLGFPTSKSLLRDGDALDEARSYFLDAHENPDVVPGDNDELSQEVESEEENAEQAVKMGMGPGKGKEKEKEEFDEKVDGDGEKKIAHGKEGDKAAQAREQGNASKALSGLALESDNSV